MDVRIVIPIDVIEQQALSEVAAAKDQNFREQWRLDDYPACPIGLVLLRQFAEAHPLLYQDYVAPNPSGLQSLPVFTRNPLWLAYTRHWSGCSDCIEGRSSDNTAEMVYEPKH